MTKAELKIAKKVSYIKEADSFQNNYIHDSILIEMI